MPTGLPNERLLETREGTVIALTAGREVYRVGGEPRSVPAASARKVGWELHVDRALADALRTEVAGGAAARELRRKALEDQRAEARRKAAAARVLPRRFPKEAPPAKTVVAALPLAGRVIVIDPGHGGRDPGAISPHTQGTEKELNLAVGQLVAARLEALGAKVHRTRSSDRYVTLDERWRLAAQHGAGLFLSIHANAARNRKAAGVEVLYPDRGPRVQESRRLAAAISQALASRAGTPNRGAKRDQRGLRVLRRARMPAVLVELGFLTHAQEARRLARGDQRQAMAQSIVEQVVAWFRIQA